MGAFVGPDKSAGCWKHIWFDSIPYHGSKKPHQRGNQMLKTEKTRPDLTLNIRLFRVFSGFPSNLMA